MTLLPSNESNNCQKKVFRIKNTVLSQEHLLIHKTRLSEQEDYEAEKTALY